MERTPKLPKTAVILSQDACKASDREIPCTHTIIWIKDGQREVPIDKYKITDRPVMAMIVLLVTF